MAVALFAPRAGLAQTVDLGGHAAFYHPFGSLISGPPIEKRMQGSIMAGVDGVVWMSGRVGFAGKVAYAPSRVAVVQPGNVTDRDATVILANARMLLAVTPLARADSTIPPWSLYVGAGAGLASRSGAVWAYSSGLTSPALVLNVGIQTPAGVRGFMRIDVEDYVSRAQFNAGAPGETTAQRHHDVVLSLSLCYRVHQ